jgi:CubicO group peptidase (beta-lactamase class C family)
MAKFASQLIYIFFALIVFTNYTSKPVDEITNYKGSSISIDTLDNYLKSRMQNLNIPGLAIALINDGKVVYHRTMGYANVEDKLNATDKTIFEGASLSKSVFACFVMKYVEEAKLDLDKPLYQYPPYPDIAHDERYKRITARMVLSHRSGFPNWREDEEDKKLKLKFEPGTDFLYSGEGYQYLAMVLKHIEGTDWNGLEAAFQNKIAKPLGMEHTVFIQTPYTQAHKAEPYDESGKWIDWNNDYWYKKGKEVFGAAYSIHSEPIGFSKWMIALMNQKLLSEESYKELFKQHSKLANPAINICYTLGFYKINDLLAHGGDNTGFTCFYVLDTEKDWGYVLFTNSKFGQKLGNELLEYMQAL